MRRPVTIKSLKGCFCFQLQVIFKVKLYYIELIIAMIIMAKSYAEINEKIKNGKAVVLTAEEVSELSKSLSPKEIAAKVDVVTTATFGAMCSSGAFYQFRTCQSSNPDGENRTERHKGQRRSGSCRHLYRSHRL